ncbi:MAG: hypothetical protein JO131_08245 [Gammaproteobacteria bacterium]|nr:hypothetical protein [Gammaproteobacteria bacterium]
MPRGGKREKAGRKTSWISGVTFEETVVVRVPKNISKQLLEIAHRLDAGEEIDLVSDSKNKEQYIKELLLRNEDLIAQVEGLQIELDTKSKQADSLQQEILLLTQLLDPQNLQCDLVTNSSKHSKESVTKSENHEQLQLLNLDTNFNIQTLKPLTSVELSRRFGKPSDFVKRRKYLHKDDIEKFYSLLRDSDPDKIGWEYSEDDRKYHPIV